ncbi:MAG: AbrB/MazE/SpoVT family DNA-binding domain-containing protein [Nanoarchaeota archaeon]|nr:AbrB/MazE/SpoVT family DNA-binding domain-containing protein [Nanoarchaeota archaeon]
MIVKTVKVSDKGQIAIPQEIREEAGIKKGEELIIVQDNGTILLEKATKVAARMKDDFKDLLRFSEQSLRKVWNNKEDDIWNEYLKK